MAVTFCRVQWLPASVRRCGLASKRPALQTWLRQKCTCYCGEPTHDDVDQPVCTLECGHIMHQRCMPQSSWGYVICNVCSARRTLKPTLKDMLHFEFPMHLVTPGATNVHINGFLNVNLDGAQYGHLDGVYSVDSFPRTLTDFIQQPTELHRQAWKRALEEEMTHPDLEPWILSPTAVCWETALTSKDSVVFFEITTTVPTTHDDVSSIDAEVPFTLGPFVVRRWFFKPSAESARSPHPVTVVFEFHIQNGRIVF